MNFFTTRARSWMFPLLAPVFAGAVILLLHATPTGRQIEYVSENWRFQFRASSDPEPDPRILVAGIGEYSLGRVGRWEDWTRNIHGLICSKLTSKPPRAVVYDLFFPEPSRDASHDLAFADALALHPGAVTGAVAHSDSVRKTPFDRERIGKTLPLEKVSGDRSALLRAEHGSLPIDDVAESAWTGFVNAPASEVDGIRRSIPLIIELNGELYPSLILQGLMQFFGLGPEDVTVRIGEEVVLSQEENVLRRIPVDHRGFLRINYRKTSVFDQVDYIKLGELLEAYESTGEWPGDIPDPEGKFLLVGQMAEGLYDFGPTPFKAIEPSVYIQANALNTILREDYLRELGFFPVMGGWLLVAWGTLFPLHRASTTKALAIPALVGGAYVFLAFLLFRFQSLLLPLVLPALGFLMIHGAAIAYRLVSESRSRLYMKNVLSAYVSRELVNKLVESGEEPRLGGERSEITAFFSDIENFSTFSERLSPERLVQLMNTYLTEMTDVLMENGGLLDKYIGDAIVGMFGGLIPVEHHAHRAVTAVIEIQERQRLLRERWAGEGGWPECVVRMNTRIGLNSGDAIVGHMGSDRRFNYTMMGDAVNLAARCESGAKTYGVYAMVTEDTRRAAEEAADDVVYRHLDRIRVKGRVRPVKIHEVIGRCGEVSDRTLECVSLYEKGLDSYRERDWESASQFFRGASELETRAEANPSRVMLARVGDLKNSPPGEDWDGCYEMTGK